MDASSSARWADTLAVFDLETTGIDVDTCRIVTAHVGVIGADGGVLEQQEWLVDPGVEIPTAASLIHGITTERARLEGQSAVTAVAEIMSTDVATVADVSGPIENPNTSTIDIVVGLVQNAFFKAILPGLERERQQPNA